MEMMTDYKIEIKEVHGQQWPVKVYPPQQSWPTLGDWWDGFLMFGAVRVREVL